MSETFMKRFQLLQTELKAPKGRINKFGGYKYRNAEDILQAVKPLLKKHGMVLTVSDDIVVRGDADSRRFYVCAEAVLHDVESDDSLHACGYAREAADKKGMDDSQITGTASSYARKYALNGLLAIDDGIDADNSEVTETADELAAEIKCTACGKLIRPFNDGKRGYTPVQIARLTQMRFNKDLCWYCAQDLSAQQSLAELQKQKGEG